MNRSIVAACAVLALAACRHEEQPLVVPAATVGREREIVLDAYASGAIQPDAVVDIKSKASGQIMAIPVATGDHVKKGQFLVQIDTLLVQQAVDQALEDSSISEERLSLAVTERQRDSVLYIEHVTTDSEFQAGTVDVANAEASFDKAIIALMTARTNLNDATVVAPIDGTILSKPAAEGMITQSPTRSAGTGTTLLQMADLTKMKVIAQFSETDISNVEPGLAADLEVDAYPGQIFPGRVEKIEPIATVDQSVTLFPVTISLDNPSGSLRPGMSSDVAVHVDVRRNVLAIPNEAVTQPNELDIIAPVIGWTVDSLKARVTQLMADTAKQAAPNLAEDEIGAPRPASRGGRGAPGNGAAATPAEPDHYSSKTRGMAHHDGIVFVQNEAGGWEPRVPVLGLPGQGYTEVVSGLREGDQIAILTATFLQEARKQEMAKKDSTKTAQQ